MEWLTFTRQMSLCDLWPARKPDSRDRQDHCAYADVKEGPNTPHICRPSHDLKMHETESRFSNRLQ